MPPPHSDLTTEQLTEAAKTIKQTSETAWTGTFAKDGVTYNVSTQVNVSIAGSKDDAMQSGTQNAIGISQGAVTQYGIKADSFVAERGWDREARTLSLERGTSCC